MSISKGALNLLTGRIVGILSGFLFILIIPRFIGPENMGFYSYWFSIFTILTILFDFGGNMILHRYIPELNLKTSGAIKSLVKKTLLIKSAVFCLSLIIGTILFSDSIILFLIIIVGSFILSIANMMASFFYGFKKMGKYAALGPVNALSRFLLLLLFFILFNQEGIIYAIATFSLAYILICIKPFISQYKSCGKEISHPYIKFLKYGLILFTGSMLFAFTLRLLIPISKFFIVDMKLIGYLGFAFIVTIQTFRQLPESLTMSIFPKLVELNSEEIQSETNKIRELYNEGWRYINMLTFPIVSGIAALIEPTIRLIIGTAYLPSVKILLLFLPSVILINWLTLNRYFLQANNKVWQLTIYYCIGFLVFCISCSIGVIKYGIVGAPIALNISTAIVWVLSIIDVYKYWKLHCIAVNLIRTAIASIVMYIGLRLFTYENIAIFLISILIGVILFLFVMFLLREITKKDYNRFLEAVSIKT